MNILVLSDTHGNIEKALTMYKQVSSGFVIDELIHCGDYYGDAARLSEATGIHVTAVRGNCDLALRREFEILETPAGKILVTHGHSENVDFTCQNLVYLAQEHGCICVCYGHTHRSKIEEISGIRLINPGSPSRPRDGSNGSCALIVATVKALSASVLYL